MKPNPDAYGVSGTLRVLLIEDSEDDALLVIEALKRGGFDPVSHRVQTAEYLQRELDDNIWDIILCDYSMPAYDAPAALRLCKSRGLDIPFIIVSGTIGEDVAVESLKLGADDYLLKQNLRRLVPAVERALQDAQNRRAKRDLEEKFRQAQKMEVVGQLAGGIAHDFNNILTATMMHLGLLQSDPRLDEETQAGLGELEAQCKRAASLTRQLLLFSRRSTLQVARLDLNALTENFLRMLRRLVGENVDLKFRPGIPLPLIEADSGMLEQVIMNLVVNARDAMPHGGRLEMATSVVSIGSEQAQDPNRRPGIFVCLTITDTGCGMDSASLKRIFEPFYTTKAPGQGTGLGLSTVYGIVAQHKGWLEVQSEVGRGSTFEVYLPIVDQPLSAPVPKSKKEGFDHGSTAINRAMGRSMIETFPDQSLRN